MGTFLIVSVNGDIPHFLARQKKGTGSFFSDFLKISPVDLGKKVPVPFFLTAPHKKTQHAPV
jgi:hypothetical protein